MIPVSGLIGSLPTTSITVRTFSGGTINAYGEWGNSTTTDVTETACVHPATSRRMREMIPEADRDRETIAVYVFAGSALARASGASTPEIQYKSRWYRVVADGDYEDQGGVRLVLASLKDATT